MQSMTKEGGTGKRSLANKFSYVTLAANESLAQLLSKRSREQIYSWSILILERENRSTGCPSIHQGCSLVCVGDGAEKSIAWQLPQDLYFPS